MIQGWQRNDWVMLGFASVVSLASSAIMLSHMPFEVSDEGYHYYVAERLLLGDVLFRDITVDSYLPGAFLPFLVAFKVNGPSIVSGRVVIAIGLAWSAAWGYVAARTVMPRGFALCFAVLAALMPGPPYKFYVRGLMLPILACGLARALWRKPAALYALAGFTGGAWVTRMDAFYVGCAMLLGLLALERGRGWRWLPVLALVAAPATVVLAYLTFTGGASEFVGKTIDVLRIAGSRSGSSLNLPAPTLGALLRVDRLGIDAWVYYGGLLVALCLVTNFVWTLARRRSFEATSVSVAAIVTGWSLLNLPQFLLARPDTYHLMQQFYALAFGSTWLISRLSQRYRLGRVAAAAMALWVFAVPVGRLSIGGRWSAAIALHDIHHGLDPQGRWYPSYAFDRARDTVAIVAAATPKHAPVIVVPFHPGLAFLAGRRLASTEPYALPVMRRTPERLNRYLENLARPDAPIAVYMKNFSTNGERSGQFKNYMPEVHALFEREFSPLWNYANRDVLIRHRRSEVRYAPDQQVQEIAALLAAHRFDDAILALAAALVHEPDSPWLYSLLSRLAFLVGNETTFNSVTQRALHLIEAADEPDRFAGIRARNVFRVALTARRHGRYQNARTLLAESVALDPTWPLARYEYARALAAHGAPEQANQQLSIVLQQSPGFTAPVGWVEPSTQRPARMNIQRQSRTRRTGGRRGPSSHLGPATAGSAQTD